MKEQPTLADVLLFRMKQLIEPNGTLMPVELNGEIPFEVKRTFFVTDVPDRNPRGMHSHFETKQLIICLKGSIDVRLHDGKKEKIYKIKQGEAIYIPNLIWDEQIYNSIETILVSLCSTHYNTEDYIHDFEQFKNLKNENNKT